MSSLNQILPPDLVQQEEKNQQLKSNMEIRVEHKDQLKLIIAELKKDPNSIVFYEPVPWQAMGLTNYPLIIKKPMDLQTLRKNLDGGHYKSYDEFFADMQQIWTNCKLYNQQGSLIYIQAEKLERKSKKLIKDLKLRIFGGGKGTVAGSVRSLQGLKARATQLTQQLLQKNPSTIDEKIKSITAHQNKPTVIAKPETVSPKPIPESPNKIFMIKQDRPMLVKRSYNETTDQLPVPAQDSPQPTKQQKQEDIPEGSIGDCLLSNHDSHELSLDSEDQNQLDIIEEMIKQKLDQVTDLKQLNKLQQFSDDQILNSDINELLGNDLDTQDQKEDLTEPNDQNEDSQDEDDDDDDDDDYECDIEKYVPFEDKIVFADKLKNCNRDVLTAIIKLVTELQPQAIDDYGNSRVQLKIDMIERDAFLKCQEIINQETIIEVDRTQVEDQSNEESQSLVLNQDLTQ